jgi:HEAT repeat protein
VLPESEIEALVQGLFSPDRAYECNRRLYLESLAPRALPFLLAAMKDPRVASDATYDDGDLNYQSPLVHVSGLLGKSGSPEAAPPLLDLLNHPEACVREHVGMCLGELAQPTCIEAVMQLLANDDPEVRHSVMCGIAHALNGTAGTPQFYRGIWPCLIPLLRVEVPPHSFEYAAKLLAEIDSVSAAPILLGALSLDNPQLRYVLEALNERRIPIPHKTLLPLIAELEPLVDMHPRDYEFAEALLAYARNPDTGTESRLREFLHSSNEGVKSGAAKALACLNSIEGHYSTLVKLANEKGVDALTEAERNYYTAALYYYEIFNGGPWQYINNPTADYHIQIIEGLRAIGAHNAAQVLCELGNAFGPSGPSANRELRNDQADALTEQQCSVIWNLYEQFPSPGENIMMLLDLYAAANAADFPHCK